MSASTDVSAATGQIRIRIAGGLLELTLDHERSRNALTAEMLAALIAACQDVPEHVRAVLLTGEGRVAFSSGADLAALTEPAGMAKMRQLVSAAVKAVSECPVPTLVRVDGICMGAALELALAADLRVCSASSVFRLPAAALGIDYPLEGLARYVDAVGIAGATRIALLGEKLTADVAQTIGLVHAVTSDTEALDTLVAAWSERLIRANPAALAGMRASLRRLRCRGADWSTSEH